MTANEAPDDPANWNESQIVSRAILEMVQSFDIDISIIAGLEYVGKCDCCEAVIIESYDPETVDAMRIGQPINKALEALIEKPVEVRLKA